MDDYSRFKREVSKLFIQSGYVLDFSSVGFSRFSYDSIGIDIMDKYRLSKGKSLEALMDEGDMNKVLEFIKDLMYYYDLEYEDLSKDDPSNKKLYKSISNYLENQNINMPLLNQLEKNKLLSNDYITHVIDSMIQNVDSFPAQTIGAAKDLLEAVMKRILEKMNISYKDKDMEQLTTAVFESLNLSKKTRKKDLKHNISDYSNPILGNLRNIITNMNLLRNEFGTGHGRGNEQLGSKHIPSRYSRLMIGSVSTMIIFLIETYYYVNNTK